RGAEELGKPPLVVVREDRDRPEIAAVRAKLPLIPLEVGDRNAGVVLEQALRTLEKVRAHIRERIAVQQIGGTFDERVAGLHGLRKGLEATPAPTAIGEIRLHVVEGARRAIAT